MKKVIDFLDNTQSILVFIPNSPFLLIISLWVIAKTISKSGLTEFLITDNETLANEMGNIIGKIYPEPLMYCIAIYAYFQLTYFIIF